jgi:hypothetical protein
MNFFLWLLLALIVVLVVGVFLWPSLRQRAAKNRAPVTIPRRQYLEEIAEEISIPALEQPRQTFPELPLPGCYGVDRLVLLARDPNWLYAYWEISATRQVEFATHYGPEAWSSTRPVLRVYDITGVDFNGNNALSYIDIHLVEETDSWHIEVSRPDHTFCVELGRMFNDGRFITLLRSNVVNTPRASLSHRFDEEWIWIEGIYQSTGRLQHGLSSAVLAEQPAAGVSSPGNWHPGLEN